MHAARQQRVGTVQATHGAVVLPWLRPAPPAAISSSPPRQFFVRGITQAGRVFRPSDWAERLAGAMSSFRPGVPRGGGGIGAFIGYSPFCVPQVIDEVRCVLVSEALRGIEPMAWDFVMNFARDNDLLVTELVQPVDAPG